jgi:hypothetical protein
MYTNTLNDVKRTHSTQRTHFILYTNTLNDMIYNNALNDVMYDNTLNDIYLNPKP